jgi:hypothetical protein
VWGLVSDLESDRDGADGSELVGQACKSWSRTWQRPGLQAEKEVQVAGGHGRKLIVEAVPSDLRTAW